jgi:hypothetical protein
VRLVDQVLEQSGLSDAGFAQHHGGATVALPGVVDQLGQLVPLIRPSE